MDDAVEPPSESGTGRGARGRARVGRWCTRPPCGPRLAAVLALAKLLLRGIWQRATGRGSRHQLALLDVVAGFCRPRRSSRA
jgi:hypothetical protein